MYVGTGSKKKGYDMWESIESELKRPVPIALAIMAAIGWILVAAVWFSLTNDLSQAERQLADSETQLRQTQADLLAQKQAAGSLADLRIQTETAGAELSRAEDQQAAVEQRLAQANSQLGELEGAVKSQSELLSNIQTELSAVEQQLQARQAKLAEAEAAIATQTQALTEVGERVEVARREEQTSRQNIAELSEEAARVANEAAGAEARVQEAREAESSAQKELQTARLELSQLAEQRTELQKELAALSSLRNEVSADISSAEEQRQALQQQVADLASNLEQRSEELAELEQRIADQQMIGANADGGNGLAPGQYKAGPVQAYFSSDGTFRMTSAGGGRNVTGRYLLKGNVLTLDEAVGQTGEAVFPMKCIVQPQANGFILAASEGSCSALQGVSFVRSG